MKLWCKIAHFPLALLSSCSCTFQLLCTKQVCKQLSSLSTPLNIPASQKFLQDEESTKDSEKKNEISIVNQTKNSTYNHSFPS